MCISDKILDWYRPHDRKLPWRHTKDPYAIWVSEIMLQQTQAETVIPYYKRFMDRFPTPDALARSDEEEVLKLWQGLGYYRRAKNLRRGAKIVAREGMPEDFHGLKALPGIGDYTAAAIASIAFDEPVAAIDGNLLRIYARLYAISEAIDRTKTKRHIFRLACEDISTERPGDFNQAMMDLGKKICTPTAPRCLLCPIRKDCRALAEGKVEKLPKKTPKKKQKQEAFTLLLMELEGRFLIEKRGPGLLEGMWGFPLLPGKLKSEDIQKFLTERGYIPKRVEKKKRYSHTFSHRKWQVAVVHIALDAAFAKEAEGRWVDHAELDEYAIPSAFQPVLEVIDGLD